MPSLPSTPPAPGPRPWLARLTARPGPPTATLRARAGAAVMAVPGRYSVTYLLIGADRIIVVDVGSVTDHERILRAIAWLGRLAAEVRFIVPTHLHMDHVIGIDALAGRLGVPVVLGPVGYEAATAGRKLRFPRGLHVLRALPTYVMQGAPSGALADWRVGLEFGFPWSKNRFRAPLVPSLDPDDTVLGLPGWTILQTPGHADDAICLYHRAARFLVAGDTVRNFSGGEWNPLCADRLAYQRTQRRLRQLAVETIFPGHGPVIEGAAAVERLRTLPRYAP